MIRALNTTKKAHSDIYKNNYPNIKDLEKDLYASEVSVVKAEFIFDSLELE